MNKKEITEKEIDERIDERDPSEYDTTWTDFDTETRGNTNPDNWWKDEYRNWVCINDFPVEEESK
tara:strand:- start:706 stop:900 length:195 start_codon:yes stop_codon:yes gene_type:complete